MAVIDLSDGKKVKDKPDIAASNEQTEVKPVTGGIIDLDTGEFITAKPDIKVVAEEKPDDKEELLKSLSGTSIADLAAQTVGAPVNQMIGSLIGKSAGGYESAVKSMFGDTKEAISQGQGTEKAISERFAPQTELAQQSTDAVFGALSQLNKIPAGWGGIADLLETQDPQVAAETVKEIEEKGLPKYMGDKNFDAYGSPLLATMTTVIPEVAAMLIPTAKSVNRGKTERAQKELDIIDQIESGTPSRDLAEYKLQNRDKWNKPTNAEVSVLAKKMGVDIPFARNMAEAMPVVVNSPAGKKAIQQEWDTSVLGLIKASSKNDIDVMDRMLTIYDKAQDNMALKASSRPIYEAGKSIGDLVNFANKERKLAGKRVGDAAEALRGVEVDYAPAVDKFIGSLLDDGVVINNGRPITNVRQYRNLDFRNSPYDGSKASEDLIRKQVKRLTEKDFSLDGFNIHTTKKNLPSLISTAKKSEGGLDTKAEILLTDLRRDLNDVLRSSSNEYKSANDDFREAIAPLEKLNEASPKNAQVNWDGINEKNAGRNLRTILSNYANADNLYQAVSDLDAYAIKKGANFDSDAVKQAFFAIALDKRLGAFADQSIQGLTEASAHRAQSFVPTSSLDIADRVITGARRKLMRVDNDNAIKAMREHLKDSKQGK